MNPVLWLELNLRISERRLWVIATFFLLAMGTMAGCVFSSSWLMRRMEWLAPLMTGTGLVEGGLYFQAGLLCLLAPLSAASRLSMEREQRTLPSLLNSTVPRYAIAWGKVTAAWVFVLWLAFLTFPFVILSSLWGGPSLGRILLGLTMNILCGAALSTLALGFSGFFGKSMFAYLAIGTFLFTWLAVLPILGNTLKLPLMLEDPLRPRLFWQEAIGYATLYHNPFILLANLLGRDPDVELAGHAFWRLACAPLAWGAMGLMGLGLAVRGLRRDVN